MTKTHKRLTSPSMRRERQNTKEILAQEGILDALVGFRLLQNIGSSFDCTSLLLFTNWKLVIIISSFPFVDLAFLGLKTWDST